MAIRLYHVDAFTSEIFRGNPAAICPLTEWLPDATMQAIATENNLSETAFFVPTDEVYAIRWFTPKVEVDLCGHATLASAFVLFERVEPGKTHAVFESRSGPLRVFKDQDRYVLDFPARPAAPEAVSHDLKKALRGDPIEVGVARDILAVFATENDVRELAPDMRLLERLERPVIATASGRDCDFVSRFFAPSYGIDEDPVTGSAHCTLVPYWARRLGKRRLRASQVSARGGELFCEDRGERVLIGGHAALFMEGTIYP
jgi:PhzF family phenazine biosynthesis protein